MTTPDAPEVSVADLRASYDRRVLTDVSFTVAPGTTTVVVGSPGSGKTTLARILLGRLAPERGEVTIGRVGDDVRTGSLFSGRSAGATGRKGFDRGLVGDPDDGVVAKATVGENVRNALPGPDTDGERVQQWLATFDLTDDEHRSARELDAGGRRRLGLARVFVTDPTLVVLDDPVAALEPADRDAVVEALLRARAASNATIVLTCYDVTTAKAVGDDAVALVAGRVRARGPVTRLLHLIESDHEFAMQFALGGKPIADSSTESLDEHRKLVGFRGYDQGLLLACVAAVGVVCLLAIVLFLVSH